MQSARTGGQCLLHTVPSPCQRGRFCPRRRYVLMVPQKPLLVKSWSVTPGDYVCFLLFRHTRRVAFFPGIGAV